MTYGVCATSLSEVSASTNLCKTLVFWYKIERDSNNYLHLFFLAVWGGWRFIFAKDLCHLLFPKCTRFKEPTSIITKTLWYIRVLWLLAHSTRFVFKISCFTNLWKFVVSWTKLYIIYTKFLRWIQSNFHYWWVESEVAEVPETQIISLICLIKYI